MSTFNKDFIKSGLKYLGYGSAALFSGFILFYFKHSTELEGEPESKHIPLDKLEKLVNKIKHLCVHIMTQTYDKKFKLKGRKTADDIEILDESDQIPKTEFFRDPSAIMNELNEFASEPNSINRENYSRRDENTEFDAEVMRNILAIELELIKRAGYEAKDYYDSLKKHLNNEKILTSMKVILDFRSAFQERRLPKFDFGPSITQNYLQIISNIFYLNLRKVQKQMKDNIIDKEISLADSQETFNKSYKKFLKQTRSEVLKFFGVEHSDFLSSKVLLRIYPFFFDKEHDTRKHYEKMNEEVNMLIKRMVSTGCIDELYEDNHPDAITGPVNKVIDFKHFFDSSKNNDNERILNTFKNYDERMNDDEYEEAD